MDYLLLQDFLVTYSLPTLIVAVIVSAVSLTLNKFFVNAPKLLKAYFPFLLAVLLYFLYDMIFVERAILLNKHAFYGGILSGSLSAIISSVLIFNFSEMTRIALSFVAKLLENLYQGISEKGR